MSKKGTTPRGRQPSGKGKKKVRVVQGGAPKNQGPQQPTPPPQLVVLEINGLCKTCIHAAVCIYVTYMKSQETEMMKVSVERQQTFNDGPYCKREIVECGGYDGEGHIPTHVYLGQTKDERISELEKLLLIERQIEPPEGEIKVE